MKLKEYIKRKKNLRFLILRMKPVGDTILTTPIFYVLKKKFPESRITVVVNAPYAEMIRNNPYCDEILAYDKKKPLLFLLKMLFRSFDISIDLMNNPRTSQISLFAWAKYRIGLPKTRNFFYNIKVDISDYKFNTYIVELHLRMLHPLGIVNPHYEFFYEPDKPSLQFAEAFLSKIHNSEEIVGINISVSSPTQKWPVERFIKLGKKLVNETDSIVLLHWAPQDKVFIESIRPELENIDRFYVLPETSLNQMGAFIRISSVFVTGDGGPKHMAVALNIPTLTIYGGETWLVWNPADSERFPFLKSDIECYPCYKRYCRFNTLECLQSISVDSAFHAVKELLN